MDAIADSPLADPSPSDQAEPSALDSSPDDVPQPGEPANSRALRRTSSAPQVLTPTKAKGKRRAPTAKATSSATTSKATTGAPATPLSDGDTLPLIREVEDRVQVQFDDILTAMGSIRESMAAQITEAVAAGVREYVASHPPNVAGNADFRALYATVLQNRQRLEKLATAKAPAAAAAPPPQNSTTDVGMAAPLAAAPPMPSGDALVEITAPLAAMAAAAPAPAPMMGPGPLYMPSMVPPSYDSLQWGGDAMEDFMGPPAKRQRFGGNKDWVPNVLYGPTPDGIPMTLERAPALVGLAINFYRRQNVVLHPGDIRTVRPVGSNPLWVSIRFKDVLRAQLFVAKVSQNPPVPGQRAYFEGETPGMATDTLTRYYGGGGAAGAASRMPTCYTLIAWNVHGNLALKLRDNEFVAFLQETWLYPGEEDTFLLPPHLQMVAFPRPMPPDMSKQWGGVAVVYQRGLDLAVDDKLSGPDLFVGRVGGVLLIGAYLLPQSTAWDAWTTVNPEQRLYDTVACSAASGLPMVIMGDLNARIGTSTPWDLHPRRSTLDTRRGTRAAWLLQLARDFKLIILNGTLYERGTIGAHTSHQPGGSATIDYVMVTAAFATTLAPGCMTVTGSEWSDHDCLRVRWDMPSLDGSPAAGTPEEEAMRTRAQLRGNRDATDLDKRVQDLVALAGDPVVLTDRLYGTATMGGQPVTRYAAVTLRGSSAAFSIISRPGSPANRVYRVSNCDNGDRATLLAIGEAMLSVPDVPLVLYVASTSVIRTLAFRAGEIAARGWDVRNGEMLASLCHIIQRRTARVELREVKKSTTNEHWACAKVLVRATLRTGLAAETLGEWPSGPPASVGPCVDGGSRVGRKVSTKILEVPARPRVMPLPG
ncbi:hypothetical protein H0H92_005398, partial [Tricholoma furcatifolium]